MHPNGMHTSGLLTVSRNICGGGVCPRGWGCQPSGVCALGGEGVPCDISHHAFDVTCMLSLLQLRLRSNAAAYIMLAMWPGKACWDTPPLWTEFLTHTFVKFYTTIFLFISTDNWLRDFLLYRLVQVFTVFLTALGQVQFVMRSENYSIWELMNRKCRK